MIEISDNMKSIWVTMMRSKAQSEFQADSWYAWVRNIGKLTSEYVKEIYGQAAIEYNGRYYTPDCLILPDVVETAAGKRERIKRERGDL